VLALLDFLLKKSKVVLVKGNHDPVLEPILKKRALKLVDYYSIDNIYFCHGHTIPKNKDFDNSNLIVIGHEHPAIGLREGSRVEKYKCYLKGRYKDKILLVQPSFNSISEGTDILREKLLSPFLTNINDFEVYVVSEEIMYFGRVKDLFTN